MDTNVSQEQVAARRAAILAQLDELNTDGPTGPGWVRETSSPGFACWRRGTVYVSRAPAGTFAATCYRHGAHVGPSATSADGAIVGLQERVAAMIAEIAEAVR